MKKVLINVNIFDYEKLEKDCYVIFDKKIIEKGSMKDFHIHDKDEFEEIIDLDNMVLMPGLVNCHSHIYSTFARGWVTQCNPKNFVDFLDQMWWKLDRGLGEKEIYYSGLVSSMEFLKNGVTTVVDHHASGKMIKGSLDILKKSVCDEWGMRGIFCFESSERFDIDQCIEENMEFSRKHNDTESCGLFGMHACLTLGKDTLKKIKEKIGDMPVHIHVGESDEDNSMCFEKYQKTPVQLLNECGLLNDNSILSHCIYINEIDKDILQNKNVYIALNPTSNLNNAVGLADVLDFEKRNIKCLLGNDGLGFNFSREIVNLLYGMHLKYKSTTAFNIDNLKEIMKSNYEYAGKILGCSLGKIEEGYEADFISLEYRNFTPVTEENLFGHYFYGMLDNFKPVNVWCKGIRRVKDYKIIGNEEKIYREAENTAQKLWQYI